MYIYMYIYIHIYSFLIRSLSIYLSIYLSISLSLIHGDYLFANSYVSLSFWAYGRISFAHLP